MGRIDIGIMDLNKLPDSSGPTKTSPLVFGLFNDLLLLIILPRLELATRLLFE